MTIRDIRSIHTLYFFHRYIPSSIARLYGISTQQILNIIANKQDETVISEYECQICSADEAVNYFIDGNKTNNKPQNIIMLCEPDKRRFQHLQLRKKRGFLSPQMEVISQDQSFQPLIDGHIHED